MILLSVICLGMWNGMWNFALAAKLPIDLAHSSIGFSVKHLSLFPVKGRFTKFEGFADYDAKKNVVTRLYIKVDVDSINTDNEDRDAHLKSRDFFHVRNDVYDIIPENRYVEFWGEAIPWQKKSASAMFPIKGKLKILKTKKDASFQIKPKLMKGRGDQVQMIGMEALGNIDRRHFGLTWQKPGTGLKEKLAGKFVGDQVDLAVNLVFKNTKTKTTNTNKTKTTRR